ncbi:hypothetical protein B0H13DRAFT_2311573 [Mycena leptocephala]|nr:hypothetical protein B0H13DRAFT_2311573 [Mycena leptocephala]
MLTFRFNARLSGLQPLRTLDNLQHPPVMRLISTARLRFVLVLPLPAPIIHPSSAWRLCLLMRLRASASLLGLSVPTAPFHPIFCYWLIRSAPFLFLPRIRVHPRLPLSFLHPASVRVHVR